MAIRKNVRRSAKARPGRARAVTPKSKRPSRARRPVVIDFHAHMRLPEVVALCKEHGPDASIPDHPRYTQEARRLDREWAQRNNLRSSDLGARLKLMDAQGVDIQVIASSGIRQYTYWAPPEESLRMERMLNEAVAEMVAQRPDRFAGLGGVPLAAPERAAQEMERCVRELGLRGVQISSHAETMELGDARLRPFWAAAERLGVPIFLHPAGMRDRRLYPFHLWNSVGQPFEEAMAMCSLFYEGALDAFPKLKICVAHGGGYLPFYAGRVDRNYEEKAFTRVAMSMSPSEYLRRRFWYDSCVYNPDMLEFLVRKVGARRIVMGSDYPSGEEDPVGFVRRCKALSAAEKEDILGRNAARLLGLSI